MKSRVGDYTMHRSEMKSAMWGDNCNNNSFSQLQHTYSSACLLLHHIKADEH